MYYICTDHQGSILKLINTDGSTAEEYSYDAWGRRRNPNSWSDSIVVTPTLLDRGYTGHEHLDAFGLINMNGRLYDPMLGRMLSPDNYIQNPGYTQNFNRYSYCKNNPMMYKDTDGNNPMMLALGVFMAASAIEHVINAKDYPEETSFKARILGGFGQGYNAFNQINSVANINVYQDDQMSINVSPSLASLGVNVSTTYTNGDCTVGIGFGAGSKGYTSSAGAGYKGFSYYVTNYGHYDGVKNQTVGGFRIKYKDFSFNMENDFLAFQHQDRWYTGAMEIEYKGFVIGNRVETNDPEGEGSLRDENGLNMVGKKNRPGKNNFIWGAWEKGQVYSAPAWVGYRFGNQVMRIGYSSPWVQDRTQNVIHRWLPIGRQSYYNKYDKFEKGPYTYYGYYNPYSLY